MTDSVSTLISFYCDRNEKLNVTSQIAQSIEINESLENQKINNIDEFLGLEVNINYTRASIVNAKGQIIKESIVNVKTYTPVLGYLEQSIDEIWNSIVLTVQRVLLNHSAGNIKGIGIIAKQGLVILDANQKPLTISPTLNPTQTVILGDDSRAITEAELMTSIGGAVLKKFCNRMHYQHVLPKLMWLKKNLRNECWEQAEHFFEICDYITWRLTNSEIRSLSPLLSYWNMTFEYPSGNSWPEDFFKAVNLNELATSKWNTMGFEILLPGMTLEVGLNCDALEILKLKPKTYIGVGIDLSLGKFLLMAGISKNEKSTLVNRVLLEYGAKINMIGLNQTPNYVPTFYGPFYSLIFPSLWVQKGILKAGDNVIDYIINTYTATKSLLNRYKCRKKVEKVLKKILIEEARFRNIPTSHLTKDLHIFPLFDGMNCPILDLNANGMIAGLCYGYDLNHIAKIYLAGLQAIAYSILNNIRWLQTHGYCYVTSIIVSGKSLYENKFQLQIFADILNNPIYIMKETGNLSVAAAILGYSASNFSNLVHAAKTMSGSYKIYYPNKDEIEREYHEKKYKVYLKLYENQKKYREMMKL